MLYTQRPLRTTQLINIIIREHLVQILNKTQVCGVFLVLIVHELRFLGC